MNNNYVKVISKDAIYSYEFFNILVYFDDFRNMF